MRDDAVVDSTGVDAVLDTMGAIRQRFSRAHRAQCARAVILSLLWACASSSLIFLNNHLLRERGFSYNQLYFLDR